MALDGLIGRPSVGTRNRGVCAIAREGEARVAARVAAGGQERRRDGSCSRALGDGRDDGGRGGRRGRVAVAARMEAGGEHVA